MIPFLISLHLLGVLFWVGGITFAYTVLRPAAGPLEPPVRLALWRRVFATFLPWVAVAIVAKEGVEKYGDLKRNESVIGTGPWLLDSYRPNVGLTYVGNPNYFLAGLPYIDRIEMSVDEDSASRTAAIRCDVIRDARGSSAVTVGSTSPIRRSTRPSLPTRRW